MNMSPARPVKSIGCCAIFICTLCVPGCTSKVQIMKNSSKLHTKVVFRIIHGSGRATPAGTEATFYFRNEGATVVNLPTYFGEQPVENHLNVSFVTYEVLTQGKWHALDVAYDGLPAYQSIIPGKEMRLLITLGPFEHAHIAENERARVKVDDLASEPFTLSDARAR
jgi:hypothetical protein